jgi:hypothetical protein
MSLFMIAAAGMAVILLVTATQRPRIPLFVAATLWLAYAVWEYYIVTGVLCDEKCNIRVDLVLFFPILGIATWYAHRSYVRPDGERTIVGFVLGALGLMIAALLAGAFGYTAVAWAAAVAALALGAFAVKSKVTIRRVAAPQ